MRRVGTVLLAVFLVVLILVPALAYVLLMPKPADFETLQLLREIRDKEVRVDIALPENSNVTVLNEVLRVIVANDTLRVLVTNPELAVRVLNPELAARVVGDVYVWVRNGSLNVNVANTPLPITGSVLIGGQPISVQVVNTPMDVRVANTPLPVTFTTPTRYYYSAHLATSAVAASKHHLCLWNPTTRVAYVTRIIIASEVTAAVSGFQIVIRVNRITSFSGGTAVSIVPWDTTNPASGLSAATTPTVTVSATLFSISINQEETGGDGFCDINLENSPIVLRTNEGICLTQYGTAGTGNLALAIVFYITP